MDERKKETRKKIEEGSCPLNQGVPYRNLLAAKKTLGFKEDIGEKGNIAKKGDGFFTPGALRPALPKRPAPRKAPGNTSQKGTDNQS